LPQGLGANTKARFKTSGGIWRYMNISIDGLKLCQIYLSQKKDR